MFEFKLSDEICREILRRKFRRDDVGFIGSSITSPSKNVEGFLGGHYKLEITYELDGVRSTEQFFIKTRTRKNNVKRDDVFEAAAYRGEVFIYNYLLPEFEKYKLDTSFAPKSLYCVGEESIIMEDVISKGFRLNERNKIFNVEECKCVLEALASLHATGYFYEQAKTRETGKLYQLDEAFPEMLQEKLYTLFIKNQTSNGYKWIETTMRAIVALVDLLPESEAFKTEFKNHLKEKKLGKIFVEQTKIQKFLGHGDLWSNNIFFERQNGTPTKACLVDFQICRYFYAPYDVVIFLYSNTDREFRSKHIKELVEFYYQTLSSIFKKHGYNIDEIYSEEDYRKSLKMVVLEGIVQAVATRTLVCLPSDILNKYMNAKCESIEDILFNKRAEIALEACERNSEYKKLVLDDLYELHSNLFID